MRDSFDKNKYGAPLTKHVSRVHNEEYPRADAELRRHSFSDRDTHCKNSNQGDMAMQ